MGNIGGIINEDKLFIKLLSCRYFFSIEMFRDNEFKNGRIRHLTAVTKVLIAKSAILVGRRGHQTHFLK